MHLRLVLLPGAIVRFCCFADPNGSTANFVKQYVKQHGDVDNAYIVGGENAVSRNTANGLADALDMLTRIKQAR